MSHRISFKSEIKDKDLAVAALKALKYDYTESGASLRITSGKLNRATINLKTGEVESDSDYHSKDDLGGIRQAYSEAEFTRQINKDKSFVVEDRRVNSKGEIKIRCRSIG